MTTYGIDDRLAENRKAITDYWDNLNIQSIGIIFALFALLIVILGYLNQHMNVWHNIGWITNLFGDFYANVSSELVSIVITVLVLDRLNARRAKEERKLALFRQAKSRSNDFALEALDQIQQQGWWDDMLKNYMGFYRGLGFIPKVQLDAVQWAGGVNLSFVNLSDVNLISANLAKANLESVNFSKADLREAQLNEANLQNANLSQANLWYVNLSQANLQKANLSQIKAWYANLSKANLQEAYLENADLTLANMSEADLKQANLISADLLQANLQQAKLQIANLNKANLYQANFSRADASHANMSEADLSEADLHTSDLSSVNLSKTNLTKANLSKADLRYADLSEANLNKTNLSEADLRYVTLTNAKSIENAIFDRKTILPNAFRIAIDADGKPIFSQYWTPDTDMTCYTNPEHPDFWEPEWVKAKRE